MAESQLEDIETRILKPPLELLSSSERHSAIHSSRTITFRHPGYPDDYKQNTLLILPAFDGSLSSGGGVHHNTALIACAIVACNAWHGYFTTSRDAAPVDAQPDQVLTADSYYFYVPMPGSTVGTPTDNAQPNQNNPPYKYPVFPSFEHWTFPHYNLPPAWPSHSPQGATSPRTVFGPLSAYASNVTGLVLTRDQSCRVSGHHDYIERAHLCPKKEVDWFHQNGMGTYNDNHRLGPGSALDDMSNAMALRPDLHRAFDNRGFVVVCKKSKWVPHFLEKTTELGPLYHNVVMELSLSISPSFLLTRLAWALFPLVSEFFTSPVESKMARIWTENKQEQVTKALDQPERQRVFNSKSRNPSPTKRQREDDREAPTETYKRRRTYLSTTLEGSSKAASDDTQFSGLCSDTDRSPATLVTPPPVATQDEIDHTLQRKSRSAVLGISVVEEDDEEDKAIEALRLEWCRKQRPTDPQLICCDYNVAERRDELGLEGPREYGGSHLCLECLGVEYRDPA